MYWACYVKLKKSEELFIIPTFEHVNEMCLLPHFTSSSCRPPWSASGQLLSSRSIIPLTSTTLCIWEVIVKQKCLFSSLQCRYVRKMVPSYLLDHSRRYRHLLPDHVVISVLWVVCISDLSPFPKFELQELVSKLPFVPHTEYRDSVLTTKVMVKTNLRRYLLPITLCVSAVTCSALVTTLTTSSVLTLTPWTTTLPPTSSFAQIHTHRNV